MPGKKEKLKNLFKKWFKRKEKIKVEEDIELKDLEKQIMELGKTFELGEELKPKRVSFLQKIGLFKTKKEKKAKEKPIKGKIKKKKGSRLFVKYLNLMDRSNKAINSGNINKAKKLYSKTRKIFGKLPHEEKKKLRNDLVKLYKKLSK